MSLEFTKHVAILDQYIIPLEEISFIEHAHTQPSEELPMALHTMVIWMKNGIRIISPHHPSEFENRFAAYKNKEHVSKWVGRIPNEVNPLEPVEAPEPSTSMDAVPAEEEAPAE